MLSFVGAATVSAVAGLAGTPAGTSQPWLGWQITSLWWAMTMRRPVGVAGCNVAGVSCGGSGDMASSSTGWGAAEGGGEENKLMGGKSSSRGGENAVAQS